ncbi:G5 domain-containing protein [Peptoniphilus raoultii]|uniref:G5 domain-containing protein n=1 Tax=Peptoniphilus raoultii TaxID=1776387 RepID=UPI0008DAAB66|nr:G5 domain-containing protein [Peptoniphilus raoultii]
MLVEKTVTEKVDRLVKVGVKPVKETVIIPHTIEYIVDPNLKLGEEVVEQEGLDGEITITISRDHKTGNIIVNRETTSEMQAMKIKIEAYNHKNKEPFETKIQFDDTKKAGETESVTEGIVGETETKVTPSKIADMDDMYNTIGEENFRDDNNNPNYDVIEKYMVEKGYWEAGKVQKITYQDGKITATYNEDNIDELLGIDEKNNSAGKVLVKGRVETNTITEKHDKVIKVGTMPEGKHSHTEKIPFGYTVEYDENMEAGTYVIVMEGKAGSETTEWTIKNSQVVGKTTVTETEPVNAVIKVGKKPVENMCPIIPPKGSDSEDSGKDKPSTPDNPKPGTDTPEKPINPSPEKPKVPEKSTPNKVEEIDPKDYENKNPTQV